MGQGMKRLGMPIAALFCVAVLALIGTSWFLNRDALRIAREVADDTGTLAAGDICNTNAFSPDSETRGQVREMFEEQVAWIVDAGMDFVIAETFSWGEEALSRAASREAS